MRQLDAETAAVRWESADAVDEGEWPPPPLPWPPPPAEVETAPGLQPPPLLLEDEEDDVGGKPGEPND